MEKDAVRHITQGKHPLVVESFENTVGEWFTRVDNSLCKSDKMDSNENVAQVLMAPLSCALRASGSAWHVLRTIVGKPCRPWVA